VALPSDCGAVVMVVVVVVIVVVNVAFPVIVVLW